MINDINGKNISDLSKEKLQYWIEYFEKYQAQNILDSDVMINGVSIDEWKGYMKTFIKILKKCLENPEIDRSVIALTIWIENDTSEDGAEADGNHLGEKSAEDSPIERNDDDSMIENEFEDDLFSLLDTHIADMETFFQVHH